MSYQFRKGDFIISYQKHTNVERNKASTLVNLRRDNHVSHQKDNLLSQTSMLVQVPGNLYLYSNDKWNLIDINTILPPNDQSYMERASQALIISLTKLPLDNSYLVLSETEMRILSTIAQDLTIQEKVTWLLPANVFYLNNNRLTALRTTGTVTYNIEKIQDVRRSFDELPAMFMPPQVAQILISPPSVPNGSAVKNLPVIGNTGVITPITPVVTYKGLVGGNGVPVAIGTKLIQKTPPAVQSTVKPVVRNRNPPADNAPYTNMEVAENIRLEQERIQKRKLDNKKKDTFTQAATSLKKALPTLQIVSDPVPKEKIEEDDWFRAITERKDIATEPEKDEITTAMDEVIDTILPTNLPMDISDDDDTIEDPALQ